MLEKKIVIEKRKNRSEKYQHIILETAHSHEMLDHFSNEDSLYSKLNPWDNHNDEKLLDLREKLIVRLWKLVDKLTDRQKRVIKLYAKENMTQMEIAKALSVNQSSVTKSLNGNVDYRKGKKSYGGSIKKIQKLAEEDPKISKILRDIRRLEEEKW
jgi:RNA polymerase sigma factor (sigma-70 family)